MFFFLIIDCLSTAGTTRNSVSCLSRATLLNFQRKRNPPSLRLTNRPLGDMSHHRADASALLDNRGYSGPLIRGVNPATLFEKAVRDRITESYYWKEQC